MKLTLNEFKKMIHLKNLNLLMATQIYKDVPLSFAFDGMAGRYATLGAAIEKDDTLDGQEAFKRALFFDGNKLYNKGGLK